MPAINQPTLNDMRFFIAVAEHRSFRKAADALGVAPSTLSHALRNMEGNLDIRLFHRTTRSVSLTEAGEQLLDRLRPALLNLEEAMGTVESFRTGGPSGTVRINTSDGAARLLTRHVVPEMRKRYPDVAIDLVTEGRLVDIVAGGFDAGARLGETVPLDMVAVRFGPPFRFLTVASPDYFENRPRPVTPDDLHSHDCIRHRFPSGKIYHWDFEKQGQEISIDVSGPLTLDRHDLMVDAARQGLGIAYVSEIYAARAIASGDLVTVLDDWLPEIPGLFLYYPDHRRVPPPLRAFIDVMKSLDPALRTGYLERDISF
ncbi:LysR family transcriptional regulator [Thalassospira sp.]|uniref:LysR family transcriptional regulator n=1 Tax=Thalassospira sp. TaxID=1912094 RepID=UPI000C3B5DA8|nr:LysR family transcriptional regulator [Thalassospira sp.]MBC08254.1 LysR family transcriptional regulator [Thalassospira sp.]|tara:strand:- start:2716 stop:3660 length:945 start_codon:yes stop_codon:yes gene_type:complete